MTAETYIVTAADRERLRAKMIAVGGTHMLPLIDLLASRVALIIIGAGKLRFDAPKRKNWLAIIGDDLLIAEGPAAFHLKSLRLLLERASAVFVMAGPIVRESYEAAADICAAGACVVVIETQITEELSWVKFVQRHAPKAVLAVPKPTRRKAA